MMRKLSAMKDLERDILAPMRWIDELTRSDTNGAVGQATQLVVGAADETDWDIFQRIDQLYGEWNLKRVYYTAFRPVRYTPLEEHPHTPKAREHRLYQVDWLKRVYQFSNEELKLAFDDEGLLPLESDPKTAIAAENLDAFPVDVNSASQRQLLRVPGVGPTSAARIVRNRRRHAVDTWRDLQAMGVVKRRAWPFLAFPGQRPPRAKQLRLELFGEGSSRLGETQRFPASGWQPDSASPPMRNRGDPGRSLGQTVAPCGEARSCVGCSMYGMPGHPGPMRSGGA